MPRRARLEVPGGIHHVWGRGNRRQTMFYGPGDYVLFLRLLGRAIEKHSMYCLSYCLITNHYHLVLETPRPTLGDAMRDINGRYAQLFNERRKTGGGRLFEDRFGSKPVQTDEQFAQLLRYVARNPVAAGLCASPSDWKWSSHAALVSPAPHPLVASERVDDRLAVWGRPAGQRYATLFEPHGPLANIEPDVSPWKLRPTLAEIVATS